MVDLLAERGGIPSSNFLSADEHPPYTAADRPDFELRCADYSILCEHKLEAPLGPRQLERCCALVADAGRAGRAYVALIASQPTPVPAAVLSEPHYLHPRGAVPHYRWEDLYPVVHAFGDAAAGDRRIARDFADYMTSLDLRPWAWGPWGDPFVPGSPTAAQFRGLWPALLPRYRGPGRTVRQNPRDLGFAWLDPIPTMPGVSLVHVLAVRAPAPADPRLPQGPGLRFRVWQPESVVDAGGRLPPADGFVAAATPGKRGAIYVRTPRRRTTEGVAGTVFVREYVTTLGEVLADDAETACERLHAFVTTCAAHLADGG